MGKLTNRLVTVVDDETAEAVADLATTEQRSESAILRRALEAYEPLTALREQDEAVA
jgi:predicted transcriptional regulator